VKYLLLHFELAGLDWMIFQILTKHFFKRCWKNTGSMSAEISSVQRPISSFIKTKRSEPLSYILTTFNDPSMFTLVSTVAILFCLLQMLDLLCQYC